MVTAPSPDSTSFELHPLVAAVFAALDEHAVRWCLLRDDDLLSMGGDIDLLIEAGDFRRACEAMAQTGFARLPAWGHGSHAFFLAYHIETDSWIWLDCVTDVRFGRYQSVRVPVEAQLLARRERRKGVAVLALNDTFWMLLLHSLLDKESVPIRHRARLQQLVSAAREEGVLARVLDPAARIGWTFERLSASIAAGDWQAADALGALLRRRLVRRQPRELLRELGNRSLRVLQRNLFRSRGLLVALLAPDGAGKTTLAAGLAQSFPTYDGRVIYMGLYQGDAGRFVRRVPGLYLATRLAWVWARYIRARAHRAAGRLVVLDRYVYDALVPSDQPRPALWRAHRWLIARSLPAPDLVLVLDVPGEVAFGRKGEHNPDSLDLQRRCYLELSARLPHAHVVDATADAENVRRRAVSLIWSCRAR